MKIIKHLVIWTELYDTIYIYRKWEQSRWTKVISKDVTEEDSLAKDRVTFKNIEIAHEIWEILILLHILVKLLYSKNTAKLSDMLAGKSCYL